MLTIDLAMSGFPFRGTIIKTIALKRGVSTATKVIEQIIGTRGGSIICIEAFSDVRLITKSVSFKRVFKV